MIAPVSIAVSSALQVSVAATGALAQATTIPSFITGLPDFSVLTSSTPTLASTLWSQAFAATDQEGPIPALEEDGTKHTGPFEGVTLWEGQEASLSARAYHAIDSSPLAQTGIALVATGAAILAARLARHRIANLAHRGREGINRGRAWVGQRWQQLHSIFQKDPSPAPIHKNSIRGFEIISHTNGKLLKLGEGGMGVVYLARPDNLKRHQVAIKVIKDNALQNPSIKERFLREAAAMNRIRHPNVVDIQNFGETEDGRPYIVMEYVDNGTMEEWQKALREKLRAGSLSMVDFEREVARLFIPTADGVTAIHDARDEQGKKIGLIHRDLKPSNIFLTGAGVPKISDFGVVLPTNASTKLTQTGMLVGTPFFLAPEVISDPTKWSEQSDVYALGVMLFYVLTGRYPYSQHGDELRDFLIRVIQGAQPDPKTWQPQLSGEMAAIVEMAMAKDPADRYKSAEELKQALENYLLSTPAAAGTAAGSGSGPQLGEGDSLAEEFFN